MTAPADINQLSPQPLSIRANGWIGFDLPDGSFEAVGEFTSIDEARLAALTAEIMCVEFFERRLEGLR